MKKLVQILISLAVTGGFILGLFQFAPVIKPDVGWNSKPTAAANIKVPPYAEPQVGWNT